MALQRNTFDLRVYYENLHYKYGLTELRSFVPIPFFFPYQIFILHFQYTKVGTGLWILDSDRRPVKFA